MRFGLTSLEEKIAFIKSIYNGDLVTCLDKINAYAEGGVDLKRLTADLLEILKDVLVMKKTHEDSELTVLNESDATELADLIDTRSLNEMIGTFLKAQIDYKTVNNIRTMFEVIILRLTTMHDVQEEKVAPKVEPQVVKPAPAPAPQPAPTPVVEQPKVEEVKQPDPVVKEEVKPEPIPEVEPVVLNESGPKKIIEEEKFLASHAYIFENYID